MQYIKVTPETLNSVYLRDEEGNIITTEDGQKIIIKRVNIPHGWKPVRVYDYERQMNENKKHISLVDVDYYNDLEKQFRKLMNS